MALIASVLSDPHLLYGARLVGMSSWWLHVGTCLALCASLSQAQDANPYTDALLPRVRALAGTVPGDLPTSIGYLSVQDDSWLESFAVEGAPDIKADMVVPAFQIRYPRGWVMVDATYDKTAAGDRGTFFPERYDQIVAALRGARLIVVTHEHDDHIGTLLQPAITRDVAFKTLLTREQVKTLIDHPNPEAPLDAALALRFLVVDYQLLLPIAPGVVLIRAPGHSPGSQMVYVKLASGREFILAGDVVWHGAGIELGHQRPESMSKQMGEDRVAIGQEIAWLKQDVTPAGITILVSHDGTALKGLVQKGLLTDSFDLSSQ